MTIPPLTLDVRPALQAGGEPLQEILQAFAELEKGQSLRLLAPFEPTPLFRMMEAKGYTWASRTCGEEGWEVIFTPPGGKGQASDVADSDSGAIADSTGWPDPAQTLDNRGLLPPEPLVRTLEAVEAMPAGYVLEIWTDRDPLHLYPELARRGHQARPAVKGEQGYRVLIRRGMAMEARP